MESVSSLRLRRADAVQECGTEVSRQKKIEAASERMCPETKQASQSVYYVRSVVYTVRTYELGKRNNHT